jgi:hypothetical protein
MTDNKIKSKSKPRWNLPSVLSRCTDVDGHISGHILQNETWEYLPSENLQISEQTSTIISTAQIHQQPFLLIEILYEKQTGILGPKVTCYRLCDSTVLGKTLSNEIDSKQQQKTFPNQRLLLTSKGLNEALRDKIFTLVHLLESRNMKYSVQKISCVFVVEDYKSCATKPDYKIKLHHTTEIYLQKKSSSTSNKKKERNSASLVWSESGQSCGGASVVSEITSSTRGYVHKTKCEGDFCLYNNEEEHSHFQYVQELEFNFHREKKEVIQRNRRSGEEEEEEEDQGEDEDDLYRSTILAATSGNDSNLTNRANINQTNAGVGGAEAVLHGLSQSYKISSKSLFLARNEMKLLDLSLASHDSHSPLKENKENDQLPSEVRHWSPLLLSWYRRIGRSVIQKYSQPVVPIPVSSGHLIGKALLNSDSQTTSMSQLTIREEEDEENDEKKNPLPSSSHLTASNLKIMTTSNHSHTMTSLPLYQNEISQLIPYDLTENSYHPIGTTIPPSSSSTSFPSTSSSSFAISTSSSKHLGRYYSTALVCERCYSVYKELNRLRKKEFNFLLKNKKNEENEMKNIFREENSSSAYLSQRMNQMNQFANQRITTYRLAKSKYPQEGKGGDGDGDGDGERVRDRVIKSENGAPKGVLPPLPWQLRQEDKREEYQQQGSAFIRNIRNKTQQMVALTAQKNEDYYYSNEEEEGSTARALDPNYDWKKTLMSRYPLDNPSPASSRRDGGGGGVHHTDLIKSGSAGSNGVSVRKTRTRREKNEMKKKPKKKFDHERLLHPYQRYMEQLRREGNVKGEQNERTDEQRSHESPPHRVQGSVNERPSTLPSTSQPNHSLKKSGKSFSLSLLPVIEAEGEHPTPTDGHYRSQSTTSLLPPLVPKGSSSSYHQSPAPHRHPKIISQHPTPAPKREQVMKPEGVYRGGGGGRGNARGEEESDGDDDEDDDDGIGWSPFVVSLN